MIRRGMSSFKTWARAPEIPVLEEKRGDASAGETGASHGPRNAGEQA